MMSKNNLNNKTNNKPEQKELYKYVYDIFDMNLKIDGIVIDKCSISQIYLSYARNEHSVLNIRLENFDEQNKYLAFKDKRYAKVEVTFKKRNGEEYNFFNGEIENISIGYYGINGYSIGIRCVSLSDLLDRELKYRVYQDTNMSYKEVIDNILSEYKNKLQVVYTDERLKKKIDKPLIQYHESDWDFMVRLVSNVGIGIYTLGNGGINIGINSNLNKVKLIATADESWEIYKDNIYDEITYSLKTRNVLLCGDEIKVKLKQNNLELNGIVDRGSVSLSGRLTMSDVVVVTKEYKSHYISNMNICGRVIEGCVREVTGEKGIAKMRVDFTEGLKKLTKRKHIGKSMDRESRVDNCKKDNRYLFPYMTPYSKTNTGLFCTPEIDDIVAVYFPTNEEADGYVMGAVNNGNSARFSDISKRNFKIEGDFDLNIDRDKFTLRNSLTKMETKDSFNVKSNRELCMSSQEKSRYISEQETEIVSKELKKKSLRSQEVYESKIERGKSLSKKNDVFVVDTGKATLGK